MNPKTFIPDAFLLWLVGMVLLASFAPASGDFAELVSYAANGLIILLFFLHGVRLSPDIAWQGFTNWRLHITILVATFAVFPALGLVLAYFVPALLPQPLWIGVMFLCALPSTVQSSIAFTSIAGGNVPGAIAAATASNLIGIILTPVLLGMLTGVHGSEMPLAGIGKVMAQLLLPFAVGQIMRRWLVDWATRNKRILSVTDRGTIVLAVYSAFSAAVLGGIWENVDLSTLLALVALCAVLLAAILFITHLGAKALGYGREDRIAIIFCGSKKTLASGVPMATILFAGSAMGPAILPLMLFHQMQLFACSWLAARFAKQALSKEC